MMAARQLSGAGAGTDKSTGEWLQAHMEDREIYLIEKAGRKFFEKRMRSAFVRAVDSAAAQHGGKLRILEVGCGSGADSISLALLGHDVTAVDVYPGMVEKARRLSKSAEEAFGRKLAITFRTGNIFSLRGEFSGYDAVLSFGLINIWESRKKRSDAIRNMRCALRKGGTLFLAATMTRNPLFRLAPVKILGPDMTAYDVRTMEEDIRMGGLVPGERIPLGLTETFSQWLKHRFAAPPLRAANAIFSILPRALKMPIAPHVLILARKKD